MSKINLIIPLFNSNYIEKQLLSIKKVQNKAINLNIIFIDDGSDSTFRNIYKKVIEKFNSLNITYFYLGEKNGQNRVCEARNKGVELAIGENLIFIDQETILSKNHLDNISKYLGGDDIFIGPYLGYNNLEKHLENDDIDFFIDYGCINKDNFSDFRIDFYQEKQVENSIWEFFCASNFFIKKDIYKKISGFDESLISWGDEDVDFGYRLCKAGYKIIFDEQLAVLNLSEKLYNKPYKILEENKIHSLSNNWLKNYEKHNTPNYKRYIYDRYNHLALDLKSKVSQEFTGKFLNKKNILIHSINGIGLGHIKRTLLTALELHKNDEIGEIIFITNSKNPFLLINAGFKVLELDYGIEDCINNSSFEEYENNNFSKINEVITKNNIDIVIHDTYFIKKVLDNRTDLSHFLVLRDSETEYLDSIKNYLYQFKKIFIPHIKEELSQIKLDFYDNFKNISYSGYVFEDVKILKTDLKKILVSPGYGGDYENTKLFFEYINELIDSNLYLFKEFEITFILGKYSGELLQNIDFSPNTKLLKFDPDLALSISECELFIGRGGYNTLNEVFFTSTKSILFPVLRNAENQDDRIDFFMNYFGADFIRKGIYDVVEDIGSIKKIIKINTIPNLNPFPLAKGQGATKDGKKIISNEIIKSINKKNILVFKHIFLPKSENFIYEELRLLENFNLHIFTLKKENTDIFPNNFNLHYFQYFEELLNLDYPKIINKDLYLKLLKYLVFLIKKHGIKTIYTEFLFDSYFIIKIKALIPEIKIISAGRGYDVYSFLKNKTQNPGLFLDKLDKILVRDEVMKEYIKPLLTSPCQGGDSSNNPEKIEIVRSVLDFSKYSFTNKDFSKLNILIGGRFVDKKGILEVLDLVSLLAKADFVGNILLFGDGELKNDILTKIELLGLSNKIEYVGFLEHKDFILKLNEYNCFINYSQVPKSGDNEGMNNIISENMASGNIVFSTLVGGIGELIIDDETGLVLSDDFKKDFEKIKDFFESEKNKITYITINSNKKVREIFSEDNSINKLEQILKNTYE